MKRLLVCILLLLVFLMNPNPAFAQSPSLDAGAYVLIDADSGNVLCEKNQDLKVYPASTTKIMTAIIALENGDLNQEMTASQSAIDDIGKGSSNIGIIPGEKITLENLMKALLISSANEAANIIADNICESREEFIDLMNKRAKELGAVNTHFANTNGLHDPEHYTTASDMARIARYAMTLPKFREIVASPSYQLPATNKHSDWPVLPNTNVLMTSDKNDLYKIDGIKTGYTGEAGYNLICSATGNDMRLISVVMDVKNEGAKENVRTYSKELLDYGFNNFKRVDLAKKGDVFRNVKVEEAEDAYGLDLVFSDSLTCVLPSTASSNNIKMIAYIGDEITAPVNKDDKMGYVEYYNNGLLVGRIDVIASRDIAHKPLPPTLKQRISNAVKSPYAKIALYVAGFILFFIILRKTLRFISRRVHSRRM